MGKIQTVREFAHIGYTLVPHCSHYFVCNHYRHLSIEYLARHLGWDFDLYEGRNELRQRLRCSQCGWNWPEVQVATQQTSGGSVGAALTHDDAMPYFEALRTEMERRAQFRARGEVSFDLGWKRRRR